MTKITIQFQSPNSTDFTVSGDALTYRQLLVLARELPEWVDCAAFLIEHGNIEIIMPGEAGRAVCVATSSDISKWQLQLVADEFYLAAQAAYNATQLKAVIQSTVYETVREMAQQADSAGAGSGMQVRH